MRPGSTTTSQKEVEAVGGNLCSSVPKKVKSIASAVMVMGSTFGRRKGSCYLEKGRPITSESYSNPLDQLDDEICGKRPPLKGKKISFTRTMQLCTKVHWQPENCVIWVRFSRSFLLFSWFGTLQIPFVPKHEKICFCKAPCDQ
ncbi:hypothetical protein TNCV_874791 [Trichonephila clavipes]|nr:hypothetical protein TNCV_874791 [Trichonephila clavipes]